MQDFLNANETEMHDSFNTMKIIVDKFVRNWRYVQDVYQALLHIDPNHHRGDQSVISLASSSDDVACTKVASATKNLEVELQAEAQLEDQQQSDEDSEPDRKPKAVIQDSLVDVTNKPIITTEVPCLHDYGLEYKLGSSSILSPYKKPILPIVSRSPRVPSTLILSPWTEDNAPSIRRQWKRLYKKVLSDSHQIQCTQTYNIL